MTTEFPTADLPPSSIRDWAKLFAAAVIVLTGVLLAAVPFASYHYSPAWEIFSVGFLIGTGVCHVTLAGAWCALGDNSLLTRVSISAGWVIALLTAFTVGQNLYSGNPPDEFYFLTAAFAGGLWIIAQIPFWIATIWFGWKLQRMDQSALSRMQFGMRQILFAMVGIGIVLAVLRIVITPDVLPSYFHPKEFLVSVFYTLAFYFGVLPVALSLFLYSRWKLALGGSLVFVVLLVVAEIQIAIALGGPPVDEIYWLFIWLHAVQLFWTLPICGILRWGGYRLVR